MCTSKIYKILILSYTENVDKKNCIGEYEMKSRAKSKEYIYDVTLILIIVQLGRVCINNILYSQLKVSLSNFIITSIISFIFTIIFLILLLKNNKKFNTPHLKIVSMFDQTVINLRKPLGIITVILMCILPIFKGGYNLYNIEKIILFIAIISIFEELLFREYIWNYLYNFTKNIKVIFISLTLLYVVFQFGYIDIIIKYMNLTYSSSYLIDIISSIIIRSVFIGGILNFCKIKLNDINICVIIHILINILIFCK